MSKLIPIILKNQRILTTKQLSEGYQCSETQITQNFNNHLDKFILDKHYYLLQGEELREFKRNIDNIDVAPNVNKLYLWTERGANRHCKILDTDKAWDQFENLEETYFRVKEIVKPTCVEDILIQSLQEMKDMKQQLNKVNHNALEAKAESAAVKQDLQDIREVITLSPNSWRPDTSALINKMALGAGGYDHIRVIREGSYKFLCERFGVDIKTRLTNKRRRMADEGICKSKRDKLTVLDVIAEDKKLVEGYVAIVKEMAIKYKTA
ncbi:ORF6N domain-containing protein [Clostridium sp. FP1]|uniref:ORF6N domain-containing protein n=1 Tax=Clostridium sp. FP1 TaxID=2724076 RepID=UPI0013E9778B|nr:ORF6N domain-containing protein [Clostridium sp. FP1]MBZ9633030.1 ORF6N domain-containing protein [Clostridium sp. FP1]